MKIRELRQKLNFLGNIYIINIKTCQDIKIIDKLILNFFKNFLNSSLVGLTFCGAFINKVKL